MRKPEQEARKRRVLEAMSRDKLTPAQVFERFGVPVKTLELWRREQREAA